MTTTSTTTAPATFVSGTTYRYETDECRRCGGTGFYSHGSCFGCHGKGVSYTRAGVKAMKAHDALVAELASVTWGELAVGDVFRKPGTIYSGWMTVVETSATSGAATVRPDGTRVELATVRTKKHNFCVEPGNVAGVRPLTVEQAAQLFAVMSRTKGVEVILPAATA